MIKPIAFTEHAFISASGLHATIKCSMSPWLAAMAKGMGADRDDADVEGFAAEGTRAHKVLEDFITGEVADAPVEVLEHCATTINVFLNSANSFLTSTELVLEDLTAEQTFDLSEWIPGGFGTADISAVKEGILFIGDLKYGEGVEVSALDNPQLMTYALGAYRHYFHMKGLKITGVVMFIGQPRIENFSTHYVSRENLLMWSEDVLAPAVKRVFESPKANPGPEQCQFCAGAGICNGLQELALPPREVSAAMLSPEQLGAFLANKTLFNKFVKEATELGLQMMNDGRELPRVKLVAGNKRKVFNEDDERIAEELTTLGVTPYKPTELVSPAQALKMIPIKEERKHFEDEFIGTIAGNPRIVPNSSNRPAINLQLNDFEKLENDNS